MMYRSPPAPPNSPPRTRPPETPVRGTDRDGRVPSWALAVAYGAAYAFVVGVPGLAALSLWALVPDPVGAAAFFAVGLVVLATAPGAVRSLALRAVDAVEASPVDG